MKIEDLMREDERPAIPPNAGHRVAVSWTVPDWLAFERDIRAAFPNAFFYEDWPRKTDTKVAPTFRILGRLDEPDIRRDVKLMFPYPGWKPELVFIQPERPGWPHHWAWKNYLSPIISFSVRPHNEPFDDLFDAADPQSKIRTWSTCEIETSYRRQLSDEVRLVRKILRMADRRCARAVPVNFGSYADFLSGNGRVSRFVRSERCLASSTVIDWANGAPDRLIRCLHLSEGTFEVWMPLERVPDSWWGDIPKPKWAQRG